MILWENKQIHTKTHSDGLFGEIRRDNNCLVCVDSSLKALYQILGDKYTAITDKSRQSFSVFARI